MLKMIYVRTSGVSAYEILYWKSISMMIMNYLFVRSFGVFVLDMWLVPYSVSMTGRVVYFDGDGVRRVARVSAPKSPTEGFSRQE